MTCDDVQIAFEQRQHGVTPALAAAEVEGHVATCASCAAYLAVSRKVSESMSTAIATSPTPLDLQAMQKAIARLRRSDRLKLLTIPLAACGAFVLVDVLHSGTVDVGKILVRTAVLCSLALVLLWSRLRSLASLATNNPDAIVGSLRGELDCRLEEQRKGQWFLAALLVAFGVMHIDDVQQGDYSMFVFVVVIGIVQVFERANRRRMQRERALLGD